MILNIVYFTNFIKFLLGVCVSIFFFWLNVFPFFLYVFMNQSEYAYNKSVLDATDKVFTHKDEAESEEIKTVQYDRCQTGQCIFLGESLHVFVMIFGL